jgi:cysteine synthase
VQTVYEGTSGSTGISLTMIAKAKGYNSHILLPEDIATEKVDLLRKLGAEVERVKPASIVDKGQFVNLARRRAEERGGFFADQFENEENWKCHYRTTGPEIYRQCAGKLDAFVSGVGTGGTLSGVAEYLVPRLPRLLVVLADPQGSGLYNSIKYGVMYASTEREGTRRRHQVDSLVEGIGINRLTRNFESGKTNIHEAVKVTDAMAVAMGRWLVQNDGIHFDKTNLFRIIRWIQFLCQFMCGSVYCPSTRSRPSHRNLTMRLGKSSSLKILQ